MLAAGVATAGSWVPSLWGDEVASIMSARRDWASLWAMLGYVDAVHGLYYALLHLWIDLVGDSPFAVRLPSGIAVGAASAGVFVLVRRRADRGTAVIAAILFLLLPRVLFMAIDARPMALATAAATWLTVLLLRLLDAPARRAWWILYVFGLAAATYLFLFVVLLIPVHAVVVLADRRADRPAGRVRLASFCVAWAGALLIAAPIVVAALRQREQIAFRAEQQVVTPEAILVGQWFMLDLFALAAWSLVAVACIAAVVHRTDPAWRGHRQLLLLAAAWTLLPTVALLAATAVVSPAYTARYLVFAAPGDRDRHGDRGDRDPVDLGPRRRDRTRRGPRRARYLEQRGPYSKHAGTDWQAVAAIVDRSTGPGDGIVFDESVRPSRRAPACDARVSRRIRRTRRSRPAASLRPNRRPLGRDDAARRGPRPAARPGARPRRHAQRTRR